MTEMKTEATTPTVEDIRESIRLVEDPEIGISIVNLGLVYDIENNNGDVAVTMTLTSPMCPIGPMIISQIEAVVGSMPGVKNVDVQLTFSPPWDPRTMPDEDTRAMLGIW